MSTMAGGKQNGASGRRAYPGHATRLREDGENRVPPAVAVVLAGVLYGLLPEGLLLGPRLLIPALEAVLLVALVVTNPRRLTRETRFSRAASLLLSGLVAITNLFALGLLVHGLVSGAKANGADLLIGALQVWATNVIAFALLYWEMDRGGPVSRARREREGMPLADFRFSHDEDGDAVVEVAAGSSEKADWVPSFADYLYLSTTNSSAFSPTDTMPLSTRAKTLMGIQATAALLTSLLVIARAVGALG
jgi:hypothetical protein